MLIRREKPEEYSEIYDLVKSVFQTAKVTSGKEQDFVNQLRSGGNYIPELALVADENGKLIGHIMLTRTYIESNGTDLVTLLLAPVSVTLENRGSGVGSALIKEGFKLAREKGYTSVVLVGDPAYYQRFGFKASVDLGIRNTNGIPNGFVMACELVPGALYGISGTITFET